MKKISAKIRNKIKTKFARSVNQLERLFGRGSEKRESIDSFKKYR